MSKRSSLIAISIVVILGIIGTAWFYYSKPSTPNSSQLTLEQLVKQSAVVVIGKTRDGGTNRPMSGTQKTADGDQTAATDYVIDTDSIKYPTTTPKFVSFYLALAGGESAEGKHYAVSGVPQLEQGKHYLIFASFGKDGRLRPAGDGKAVAEISGDTYTLPRGILATTTFTAAELITAITSSSIK